MMTPTQEPLRWAAIRQWIERLLVSRQTPEQDATQHTMRQASRTLRLTLSDLDDAIAEYRRRHEE